MLEKKWLGDKAGQGFYKKEGKDAEGRDLRHVLDWQTLDYQPGDAAEVSSDGDGEERGVHACAGCAALHADARRDKAAAFYWPLLTELFTYAANRVSEKRDEPADNIVEIDPAMRTGFNWELGPFEMFDAAGVRATTEKMRAAGAPIAANVEKLLAWADKTWRANPTWYKDDAAVPSGRLYFDPFSAELQAGSCG